jgi:hypothetical protein
MIRHSAAVFSRVADNGEMLDAAAAPTTEACNVAQAASASAAPAGTDTRLMAVRKYCSLGKGFVVMRPGHGGKLVHGALCPRGSLFYDRAYALIANRSHLG